MTSRFILTITSISLFVVLLSLAYAISQNQPSKTASETPPHITTPRPTVKSTPFPKLTLNTIFEPNKQAIKSIPESKTITITATGDVMLGRSVNYSTLSSQDFDWAFRNIKTLLGTSDVTLINLEGTLLSTCQPTNQGMKFCGDSSHSLGLSKAGIDIANLANNHSADFGESGLNETLKALGDSNIKATGLGSPTYIKVKNTTISFVGFNSIYPYSSNISWASPETVALQIQDAKSSSNITIASFHWGTEYAINPNENQKSLAHLAIDSGADAVIGHHPHWIQPIELYKGKPIFYSLGNFIFDQMWSQKTTEGLVSALTFFDGQLVDINLTPVVIEDYGQPSIPNPKDFERIINYVKEASTALTPLDNN